MKLPKFFYFRVKGDSKGTKIVLEDASDCDVVEVTRCLDCRYAPTGTDNGEEYGFGLTWPDKEEYKCPYYCDDGWYSRKPKPDFFCANGKRKEGGQD